MYDWRQGEAITAAKLNKTGQQFYMNTVDTTAPGGGLVTDICSCYWCDPGSTITFTEVQQAAHALGNVTLEYDDSCDEWKPRGGAPGVTGKEEFAGGALKWLTEAEKDGSVWNVWQRINTNPYGSPTSSSIIVSKTSPGATVLWGPNNGTVYRHLATVQWDSAMRRWNITNQNKALLMPVARHFGWMNNSFLDLQDDTDANARVMCSAHIIPVAGCVTANTVPIAPLVEVGGVSMNIVTCGDNEIIGLGISAGIEFYDCCSVAYLNCHDPRPQGKVANVDVFGKDLSIQPVGGHDCRPWQFLVTHDGGRFDPTGNGDWGCDPGSAMFAHDERAKGVYPWRPGLIRGITGYGCMTAPWIDDEGVIHVYSPSCR